MAVCSSRPLVVAFVAQGEEEVVAVAGSNLVVRFTAVTAWENISFSQGFVPSCVAAEEAREVYRFDGRLLWAVLLLRRRMMRAGNGEICSSSAALI